MSAAYLIIPSNSALLVVHLNYLNQWQLGRPLMIFVRPAGKQKVMP